MQIVTPSGKAAYAFVSRPQKAMEAGKPEQYSLTLIWDENDPKLKKLKAAIEQVAIAKFGAKAPQMLAKGQLKNPLRPGSDRDSEEFEGGVFLTARSTDKPQVVDREAEPIMDPMEFYSGCQARMDIYIYAYDKAGNKGVSAILNSVQKLGDGERMSGRRSAQQAFEGLDDEAEGSGDDDLL